MKNSISSNKNGTTARPTTLDENSNEVKSTNINVLLNRVKLDQKKESRKKIIFTAATSLGLVIFGVLIFWLLVVKLIS